MSSLIMRSFARKTAPKVRNGKTQRKNRPDLTPHHCQTRQPYPAIDRQRPGEGYRHLITVKQLKQFIELLPDWQELSCGLNAVILAPGDPIFMGWYLPGRVALSAWNQELPRTWETEFIQEHAGVLDRLGVERGPFYDEWFFKEEVGIPNPSYQVCKFTETSARGFQLMHVFLHELGHHHDRMTTKTKRRSSRGESYAEEYANKFAQRIWDDYFNVFGW
jgi:hypothetical protein